MRNTHFRVTALPGEADVRVSISGSKLRHTMARSAGRWHGKHSITTDSMNITGTAASINSMLMNPSMLSSIRIRVAEVSNFSDNGTLPQLFGSRSLKGVLIFAAITYAIKT